MMQSIPKGHVRTFGVVAEELGASARAVGTACGRNPIPIIIPCHRIVAANGKMGGFSAAVAFSHSTKNCSGYLVPCV